MKVIIISGATATGKTDLGIKIARQVKSDVINFDSLLLYQELNIGTAKPSLEERGEVLHHMIDVSSIFNPLNAADYVKRTIPIINELHSKNKIPILVGGSGFYLQALLFGMYDSPTSPSDIIKRSQDLYEKEGIAPFHQILQEKDHASFERYHENDHYRIRRAVEHFWTTGSPLSEERQKKDVKNKEINLTNTHGWETFHIYLKIPKEEHFEIITNRTHKMIETGLLDEVQKLITQGFTGHEKPLQSIGYKEALDFLRGNIKSLEECKEKISISTRQLAKAQKTWFNRIKEKETFNPLTETKDIFEALKMFLQK